MYDPPRDSFFLSPITPEEIETEISNLKIGKAVGPSSIPVSILKILKGTLSEPLQIIFNASFLTGIVPEWFKVGRVTPVFKKGSQASLNNYRPIALLSIFNKFLEKMVYNRLSNYLEKRQLILCISEHATWPFNKDLGSGIHTIRMERGDPGKAS